MSFTKRALGALAAGAITLPFLASPALAAPGDTPIPALRSIDAFCANPTASPFTDVTSGNSDAEFLLATLCLKTAGVTLGETNAQGTPTNTYGSARNVTRLQMASFIARLIDAAVTREVDEAAIKELPAAPASSPFRDVPRDNSELTNNILRLNAAGIALGNPGTAQRPAGIGADLYGPDLLVTRGQMASFINRAVAYMKGGNPAQAGTAGTGFSNPTAEYYVDPQQEQHARNINGITAAGIANGVGTRTVNGRTGAAYDGLAPITRQQMARFLARTLATLFSSDRSQVAGLSIVGLLENLSATFPDNSRTAATRTAAGTGTAASVRDYAATGLRAGVEYRITLVDATNVTRATNGTNTITFLRDGSATPTAQGNFLANAGDDPAFITRINSSALAGTARTVTFVAGADGTVTFQIDASAAADVVPVIYINGAAGRRLDNGGDSPRLELDAQGRPVEFFGVAGRTQFV